MARRGFLLAGVLLAVLCGGCVGVEEGYRKATVIKMSMIFEPDNLADDVGCRELWGNVARFGIEMDRARNDWNEVVLESATALIEQGCVKRSIE